MLATISLRFHPDQPSPTPEKWESILASRLTAVAVLFVISLLIEGWVLARRWKPVPRRRVWLTALLTNLASYFLTALALWLHWRSLAC